MARTAFSRMRFSVPRQPQWTAATARFSSSTRRTGRQSAVRMTRSRPGDVRHQGVALGLAGGGRVEPVDDVRMDLAHDDGRHAFRRGEGQEVRFAPAGVAEAVDETGDGHEARHGEEGALAFEHGAPLIPESRGRLKVSPMHPNPPAPQPPPGGGGGLSFGARPSYDEGTMPFKDKTMPLPAAFGIVLALAGAALLASETRPRAREFGLVVGVLPTGPLNAITDVAGVAVGQVTIVEGRDVRTGVTAILPHGGNVFQDKVPAGISVGNGYGKLTGVTQVMELGTLETPIVLTNTLSVPTAAEAVIDWTLGLPGNERVASVNPVVGETNDGWLNDIRGRHVTKAHVLEAIRKASGGPVAEGAVGAGTGTTCFDYKGGIGTASRRLPDARGGYTVGVLVQTNFGGVLTIQGVPFDRKDAGSGAGAAGGAGPEPGRRRLLPDRRSHRRAPRRPQPRAPGQAGPARHRPDRRLLLERQRRLRRRLLDRRIRQGPPPLGGADADRHAAAG